LLTSKFTTDDTGDANKAVLLSTLKRTQSFPSESSKTVRTEIFRYKDNSSYLFPTTNKMHDSTEKAPINTQPLHTTNFLREIRKNIIQSIDHILNHNLVREDPLTARFVSDMERKFRILKNGSIPKFCLVLVQELVKK
jgi:hypothetical protein